MALTDVSIRKAKAGPKPYKMGDSSGLFLLVQPSGGKLWRMKYRVDGREKKLGLGTYPEVGLAEARRRRDAAREQMAQGKDPSREKQREKARARLDAENTFAALASEFCEKRRHDGSRAWAPATAKRCEYLLSVLNSSIGNLPIADIEPADILTAVRRIESKGKLESAKRTLQLAGSVFRYAVATARLKSDPTRDLRGALMNPTVTHYGAVLDPEGAGQLLRAIDGYEGQPITKLAMQLAPNVFVRPGVGREETVRFWLACLKSGRSASSSQRDSSEMRQQLFDVLLGKRLADDLLPQLHQTYLHSAGRSASRICATLSPSAGWPTRRNPAVRPSMKFFFERM